MLTCIVEPTMHSQVYARGGGELRISRVIILYCLQYRGFRIPVHIHIVLKRYTLHSFKDVPVLGPIVRSYLFLQDRAITITSTFLIMKKISSKIVSMAKGPYYRTCRAVAFSHENKTKRFKMPRTLLISKS